MSDADDALRQVKQAAQRRAMVERESERARAGANADLASAIRQAQAAGVPTTHIARELGISRQRVYKLLERE